MKVFALFLVYFWVLLIHILFVGVSGYSVFGKHFAKWKRWQVVVVMMLPIIFFEFYWIPVMQYLDVEVMVKDNDILSFFNLKTTDNIVNVFHLSWFQPLLFIFSGVLAERVGRYFYS